MEGLDFGDLSDDQLLGLLRAALREAAVRHPALRDAAEAAVLDEAERIRVAAEAGDQEAARLRAIERQRIAQEAAQAVRERREAEERATAAARGARAAEEARRTQLRREEASKRWLRRAAALVGREPQDITLLLLNTAYGRRVLVDEGADTYSRDHLVDWTHGTGRISTARPLVLRKPDLAALAAEFEAAHSGRTVKLVGSHYTWTGETP